MVFLLQEYFETLLENSDSVFKGSTAGISRSVVQYSSAKSQICQIVSCGIVLVVLYFLADIFVFVPSACLAAVIIAATAPMFDPAAWKVDSTVDNK